MIMLPSRAYALALVLVGQLLWLRRSFPSSTANKYWTSAPSRVAVVSWFGNVQFEAFVSPGNHV